MKATGSSEVEPLLQNHIEFLLTHRGRLLKDGSCTGIESEKPEFNFALLSDDVDPAKAMSRFSTIYLYPTAQNQESTLLQSGYSRVAGLSYMVLEPESMASWQSLPELLLKQAQSESDFELFSQVQAAGFCETKELYDAWFPFLSEANQRNCRNEGQRFWLGELDGNCAGVCLTVKTGRLAGIYAVATLPQFRKRGVSTTIMKQAVLEAQSSGCKQITLQVVEKSYAEAFYARLGFKTSFSVSILKR